MSGPVATRSLSFRTTGLLLALLAQGRPCLGIGYCTRPAQWGSSKHQQATTTQQQPQQPQHRCTWRARSSFPHLGGVGELYRGRQAQAPVAVAPPGVELPLSGAAAAVAVPGGYLPSRESTTAAYNRGSMFPLSSTQKRKSGLLCNTSPSSFEEQGTNAARRI